MKVDLGRKLCASMVLLVCVAASRSEADERSWAVLETGSGAVGQLERESGLVDGVWVRRETLRLSLRMPSGVEAVEIETTERETPSGRALSVERSTRVGRVRSAVKAERAGAQLRITRDQGGATELRSLELPADWLLSAGLAQAVGGLVESGAGRVRYRELDLDRLELTAVEIEPAPAAPSAPGSAALVRRSGTGERESESIVTWLVRERRMRTSFRIWGQVLEVRECDGRCGLAPSRPLDPLERLTVPSPYRIPKAALAGTIRYVLAGVSRVPVTGEQAVTLRDGHAIVTVCAEGCAAEAPPTADELARLRAPTLWLQSDHATIRRLAGADAAPPARPHVPTLLPQLVKRVQRRLDRPRWDPGFASALEAARSREGDCTEFAVLLAALARARGIPARVAMGLAYSSRFTGRSHVFSPHAWVQVWDGSRWRSFDAGMEPFDAGHVALAVGSGNPEDYAGLMAALPDLRILDAARIDAPGR